MEKLHEHYKSLWTPEFWQGWRETNSRYRQYKSARDREIALRLLDLKAGDRVLEIGCGYGWISRVLVAYTPIRWTGVDISLSMLRQCLDVMPHGVGTLADALFLPFCANAFDVVLCSGVLMHVANERNALAEMVRVLKPKGRLVISTNNVLSPFAAPVWAWNARKSHYKQSFRFPWCYKRWLKELGLHVEQIVGDTLFAIDMQLPRRLGSFPPQRWFKLIARADRLIETPLRYFAYELWFAAVK